MVSLEFARKLHISISKNFGIGYDGQSSAFYGMVRSAKVTMANVVVTTPMFVMERHGPECPVILGRLFRKKGRKPMWNDDHGACHGMVYDENHGHSVEFKAVSAVNSSDVRFKQFAASKWSLNYQADS